MRRTIEDEMPTSEDDDMCSILRSYMDVMEYKPDRFEGGSSCLVLCVPGCEGYLMNRHWN